MENRIADETYCGVDKKKITSASPKINLQSLERYSHYQKERTSIYKKKEVLKEQAPWTNDEILKNYRFTNTRRELDRESKWLIQNVINNVELTYHEKLLNCALFRITNKGETFELFGGPIRFHTVTIRDIEKIKHILEDKAKEDPDYVFFNAAYILGGVKATMGREVAIIEGKQEDNMFIRMVKFVYYNRDSIIKEIIESKSQLDVFNGLQKFKGFARFIAYQVFVDFTYIKEFPFSENEFTISGPGCDRGIDWMCEDFDGLTYEEFIFWFRDNLPKLCYDNNIEWNPDGWFDFLDKSDRNWGVMQIENSFCEFDKYSRTLLNNGRPKQKYKSVEEKKESKKVLKVVNNKQEFVVEKATYDEWV